MAPYGRTRAWAKAGRVKTTAKVCSKATTSGPGMGGIALRDAGQASPPARKAPRAHTGPQKGQSRGNLILLANSTAERRRLLGGSAAQWQVHLRNRLLLGLDLNSPAVSNCRQSRSGGRSWPRNGLD